MRGSTGNVFNFEGTSQLNSAKIQDLQFGYTTVTPEVGTFNGMVTLDADQPILDMAQAGLSRDLKKLIERNLQTGIDNAMPITF